MEEWTTAQKRATSGGDLQDLVSSLIGFLDPSLIRKDRKMVFSVPVEKWKKQELAVTEDSRLKSVSSAFPCFAFQLPAAG